MRDVTIYERIIDIPEGQQTVFDINFVHEMGTDVVTFMSLEELNMLYSRLHRFLEARDPKLVKKKSSEEIIIEQFVKSCEPSVLSSQEIMLALAEIADLSISDVSTTMTRLGYSLKNVDGKLGWLIEN